MSYKVAIGQLWRSVHTARLYRVVGFDPVGIRVEDLQAHFPLSPLVILPPAMFCPEQMIPEDMAIAQDFDAYLNKLADLLQEDWQ
jgi:hypothetical protein